MAHVKGVICKRAVLGNTEEERGTEKSMEVERGQDHDVDTAHREGGGCTGPCYLGGNKRMCLSALLREVSCVPSSVINSTACPD